MNNHCKYQETIYFSNWQIQSRYLISRKVIEINTFLTLVRISKIGSSRRAHLSLAEKVSWKNGPKSAKCSTNKTASGARTFFFINEALSHLLKKLLNLLTYYFHHRVRNEEASRERAPFAKMHFHKENFFTTMSSTLAACPKLKNQPKILIQY